MIEGKMICQTTWQLPPLNLRGVESFDRVAGRFDRTVNRQPERFSDPDGIDHGLEQTLLTFAMCYVAAHYVLDLINKERATSALEYCDKNMD